MTKTLTEIFANLRAITGQSKVSVRVDCANLESIYIEANANGRFVISDRYYTLSYLSGGNGDTYRTITQLGTALVEEICASHGVALIDLDPAGCDNEPMEWMAIGTCAETDAQVRHAVNAVAACVDAIFDYALIRR